MGSSPSASKSSRLQDRAPDEPRRTAKTARRRPWWAKLMIGVAVLLLLFIAAVQVVLWTDLPRTLVIDAVQKQLGLRASASSLSTGWFGNTTLRDVKLGLPMADTSVIEAPELRVKHSGLASLILGRPLRIESIEIDRPVLHVSQDAAGRWNLLEVIELAARTGGKEQVEQTAVDPAERPEIPAIRIADATIDVTDNTGRRTKVERLTVTGQPDPEAPALLWRYDIAIPDRLHVIGQLVPGGDWRHEVKLNVAEIRPYVEPFAGPMPPIRLRGEWSGQAGVAGINGRLELEELSVGDTHVSGPIAIEQQGASWIARPQRLMVRAAGAPDAVATAGQLRYDGATVAAEGLAFDLLGGHAGVEGKYSLDGTDASAKIVWRDLVIPGGASGVERKHSGSLEATLRRGLGGRVEVHAGTESAGRLSAARSWESKLRLDGEGDSWRTARWKLTAERLLLQPQDHKSFSLDGMVITAVADGKVIKLDSIQYAGERLTGNAQYAFDSGRWAVNIQGSDWPAPLIEDESLAFAINASGTQKGADQRIDIQDSWLRVRHLTATVNGYYVASEDKPLAVKVALSQRRPTTRRAPDTPQDVLDRFLRTSTTTPATTIAATSPASQAVAEVPRPASAEFLDGSLEAETVVHGTLDPLELTISGSLSGRNVAIRGSQIGRVSTQIAGYARGKTIALKTTAPLKLLGGRWDLGGMFHLGEEVSTVTVNVHGLPLQDLRGVMGDTRIAGMVNGRMTIAMPGLAAGVGRWRGDGEFVAENVAAPFFFADRIDLRPVLREGRLIAAPITMRRGEGTAQVAVSIALAKLDQIEARNLALSDWPVPLPAMRGRLVVDGSAPRISVSLGSDPADPAAAKLRVDVPSLHLTTLVWLKDQYAGHVKLDAAMAGRRFALRELGGRLLGADLSGRAAVDLDKPLLTDASIGFTGAQPHLIADFLPGVAGMTGRYDVAARIKPAQDRDALEPLLFEVQLDSHDGRLGEMPVGNALIRGFANLDDDWGFVRAVLQDVRRSDPANPSRLTGPAAPNTIQIAGGVVELWGRLVRNDNEAGIIGATSHSAHLRLGVRDLNLDQIVHAFDPKASPTQGVVQGTVILFGTTHIRMPPGQAPPAFAADSVAARAATANLPFAERLFQRMHGDVQLTLLESNLANVKIFNFLYNAMNLGKDMNSPTGHGSINLRIEGSKLEIVRLYYFNKGVEVRSLGTIIDIDKLPNSPIAANAIGLAVPLRDTELPLLPDVNKFLTAIQAGATVVEITGTVADPVIRVVPFKDMGKALKDALVGEAKAAK